MDKDETKYKLKIWGDNMEKIKKLQEIIDDSKKIVFFGGAGVSTESGMPDFRSVDGLYNQTYDYPPEEILSRSFFDKNKIEFYRFYKNKMIIKGVKPNYAHEFLYELEKKKKLLSVITQNIDGLHTEAGNSRVLELHGSIKRNYCVKCGCFYDENYIINSSDIPYCKHCGGVVKPDVLLYQENLDEKTLYDAVSDIMEADTLIVGGTSLTVYPAAGMIKYFNGKNLVLINRDKTSYDNYATLVINEKIGEVFKKIKL